jgi:hypothetical protein
MSRTAVTPGGRQAGAADGSLVRRSDWPPTWPVNQMGASVSRPSIRRLQSCGVVAGRERARSSADAVWLGRSVVEFVVIDGVQMPEMRRAPRVALEMPVRASLLADNVPADPIETVTANLSVLGALLSRQPGLGEGPWQIELFLPGEATPVRATAVLVRHTARHLGVAFAELTDADLTRLEKAIADAPPAVRKPSAETVSGVSRSAGDVVVSRDTDLELTAESGPDIVFIASS